MEQFNIRPIQYSAVKENFYIFINSRPCKISTISHAKTGKHGSMKVRMVGYDVITNKKYECMGAGHTQTKQFDIVKNIFQVLSMEPDTIHCLDKACEQISYSVSQEDPMYEEVKKQLAHTDEKDLYVTLLFAPIEMNDDQYNTEHIIEHCNLE